MGFKSKRAMLKSILNICFIFLGLTFLYMGCKDVNSLASSEETAAIKAVIPARAPFGATVVIGGVGFGEELDGQEVYFNKTSAPIESLNDTTIQTLVPLEATSGAIKVITNGDTLTGPSFTVDTTRNLFLSIDSIDPNKGKPGDQFKIHGRGFNPNPEMNKAFINQVQVPIVSADDTMLTARVSPETQTGHVAVVVDQDTAIGPVFTVQSHTITSISPEAGSVGAAVTIIGSGFGNTIDENTVTFNGVEAPIETASATEIVAIVPKGATTGPVAVTVNGVTVEGPTFTIESSEPLGAIKAVMNTSGSSLDSNGYLLTLNGGNETRVDVEESFIYGDLEAGSYELGISDIASNCRTSGDFPNPRTVDVTAEDTTITNFYIYCETPNEPPIASFTVECANLSCAFDASESGDSDGSVTSYEWDFGDGMTNSGQTVNHNYEVPGTYTVQLSVTDDDGASGSTSQEVTVTLPKITGISPESGPVRTAVTITGSGFGKTIEENIVTFNGLEAPIETASEKEIMAIVPDGATTGPVKVTANGYTVSGPEFTVQQPKILDVAIETEGSQIDEDGYTLSVTGQDDRFVKTNDNIRYNDLYADEVQVGLSGLAGNCRVEGENPRNVVLNNSDNAGYTAFTVDCTYDLRGKIVFTTDRDNYGELYKQNSDGSGVQRITNTTDYYEKEPAISPDGLKIAFSNNKGGGRHILVMDSDGSDIVQLTDDGYNKAPSWSPDGSKIVFARSSNSDAPSDIYIMDADGSDLKNITNTSTARESNPDWAPDGSRIVYESYADGDTEIHTIRPDGTDNAQITDNTLFDSEPEWSPSGDRIAFVRNLDSKGDKVHIMNSDGTNVRELTPSSTSEVSPTWSPDGSMIAFSRYIDGYYHIHIYSVDFNDILSAPYTTSNDRSPHWNYK